MLEDYNTINEAVEDIKKITLPFSKFYSKMGNTELSQFIYKDRETQDLMLDTIYKTHSELEQLLREIMIYDINAETLRVNNESSSERQQGAETEEHQD